MLKCFFRSLLLMLKFLMSDGSNLAYFFLHELIKVIASLASFSFLKSLKYKIINFKYKFTQFKIELHAQHALHFSRKLKRNKTFFYF